MMLSMYMILPSALQMVREGMDGLDPTPPYIPVHPLTSPYTPLGAGLTKSVGTSPYIPYLPLHPLRSSPYIPYLPLPPLTSP